MHVLNTILMVPVFTRLKSLYICVGKIQDENQCKSAL